MKSDEAPTWKNSQPIQVLPQRIHSLVTAIASLQHDKTLALYNGYLESAHFLNQELRLKEAELNRQLTMHWMGED
jgi:hypothetical protein